MAPLSVPGGGVSNVFAAIIFVLVLCLSYYEHHAVFVQSLVLLQPNTISLKTEELKHHHRVFASSISKLRRPHELRRTALFFASTTDNKNNEAMPTDWRIQILNKLSAVIDPDLNEDIVTLGFIKNLVFDETTSTVSFDIELTTPACPVKESFQSQAYDLVTSLDFVSSVKINMTSQSRNQPISEQGLGGLSGVAHIIAISSCKGGVGKSTVAVNLAYTLKNLGARVGIFDADVYGPSLPTMVIPKDDAVRFLGRQISPLTYEGVKLMSFGYVNDGAAIMRGPMVDQLLNQLLTVVNWGELDYLILDMPPGTGDIQLTLSQRMNITAAVIVTTPQELSYVDVARGIDMFGTVEVPCVAVVENMAYYKVPAAAKPQQLDLDRLKSVFTHKLELNGIADDGLVSELVQLVVEEQRTSLFSKENIKKNIRVDSDDNVIQIFGPGHLTRLSNQFGIEHTFAIPLMTSIANSGDVGVPFILRNPDSPQAAIFRELASSVVREISKLKHKRNSMELKIQFDTQQHMIKVISPSLTPAEKPFSFAFIKPAILRRDCKCAACVEEMSGRQILQPQSVSEMIKPTSIHPCGNYALSIVWSDNHRSLYPYRQIHRLVNNWENSVTEGSMPPSSVENKGVII